MNILGLWNRLAGWPGGKCLFSWLLAFKVPYTGTLCAQVIELSAGHARVKLKERWRLRNHLKSIHAIALINLGEMVSGLAVIAALPSSKRGIVTRLEIDYLKKARGTLIAESDFETSHFSSIDSQEVRVESLIRDAQGDLVARVTACWKISDQKAKA